MTVSERTNQGGSTAVFVFVGIALLIALASSIYFVKAHGDQVRKDQSIATYEQQKTDQAKSEADKKSKESNGTTSNPDKSGEVTAASIPSTGVSSSPDLPVTGPETLFSQIIGVGMVTMAISAYVLSRRSLVCHL